ncbi:MAG: DUF5060 domain-containing protein [Kiritimatiellae bacterium]|nr:DUF5060 domain-containing protein [Kiritimatiellia bacterium]
MHSHPKPSHILRCILLAAWLARPAAAEIVPLLTGLTTNRQSAVPAALSVPLVLPGQSDLYLFAPSNDWVRGVRLQGSLIWPDQAPMVAQLLAFLKDRDGRWYQSLRVPALVSGTNRWDFDFEAGATSWQPVGHHTVWHQRVRLKPEFVGLRVFTAPRLMAPPETAAYTGVFRVAQANLIVTNPPPGSLPAIRNLRLNAGSVPCYGLFEARFDLPDRYADPFDPEVIDVSASIETPDGRTNLVYGFYLQDYFRLADSVGEQLLPQGRPEWRVRYCPTRPGIHKYTLTAKDAYGSATWGPGSFVARPSDDPGFVRVSRRAPLHFELDNAQPFFPIGHNTRSPFDSRMDTQFPWRFRHPEGSLAYQRYFRDMRAAGENLAEVWMCSWSLGLEWSPVSPGYHGAGDYHLGNAWDLDEVLRWAREQHIRINLALNNHGRVGTWYDGEWPDHPYNEARGGFIPSAALMSFFDDPRALQLQRRLLRYIVARWGWDTTIFSWELWSELDLAGAPGQSPRTHFDPRVIEWHRQMGDYLRATDPNRHLISTHLSDNYQITNPELAKLPQLDHCAVDAYHGSPDPLHIVQLISGTAAFYAPFAKPVLITEFGGSSMAAGLTHLKRELHAALWSSMATTLAGAPLFWWWQVVEEQNLYGMYAGLARFMADVDRRDPRLSPVKLTLAMSDGTAVAPAQVDSVCQASPDLALGWVFIRPCFAGEGKPMDPPIENLQFTWQGCSNTLYRVEFWDTETGHAIKRSEIRAVDNRLTAAFPPLSRDMAIKIRSRPSAVTP